jgi:hypothetical protein
MLCEICSRHIPAPARRVSLASDSELAGALYLRALAGAMRALGLPRRAWRDAIADALRDFEGELLGPDGRPVEPPFADDHFPEDEDQRWVSDFTARAAAGRPIRLRAASRERVRLIDLFFRIRFPALAATFGRLEPVNDNAAKPAAAPAGEGAGEEAGEGT